MVMHGECMARRLLYSDTITTIVSMHGMIIFTIIKACATIVYTDTIAVQHQTMEYDRKVPFRVRVREILPAGEYLAIP